MTKKLISFFAVSIGYPSLIMGKNPFSTKLIYNQKKNELAGKVQAEAVSRSVYRSTVTRIQLDEICVFWSISKIRNPLNVHDKRITQSS